MDSYGDLKLKWANGYDGSKLLFIDNNVLLYACKNILVFIDKESGSHIKSVKSEGKGIGPIAVSQEQGLIAYCEDSLEPLIYIMKYPDCSIMHTMKGDAVMKYQDIAFSGDGKKLVSLSGVPDFLLTTWIIDTGMVLSQRSVDSSLVTDSTCVSFNPLNWKQLVLVGDQGVAFYSVECCDSETMMTDTNIILPEATSPVGAFTQPKANSNNRKFVPSRDKKDGHMVDLNTVYYDKSYEEISTEVCRVAPSSYCWTPHNSIYIGCHGGQLLIADCDNGSVELLANPAIPKDDADNDHNLVRNSHHDTELDDPLPKTAHALLHENSLQSITLSLKGLFVGGQDGHVYLFDHQSKELNLLDSCQLPHPVKHMSWSVDYTTLGIGTDNGCVYSVDPGDLESFQITQEHLSTEFIGIDTIEMANNLILTCRIDGTLQMWDITDGSLLSTFTLPPSCASVTAMGCPNSSSAVILGTDDGYLYTVSAADPMEMKLVRREKMFNSPVKIIRSDVCGRFIVVASTHGTVLVCSSLVNRGMEVLGHTAIDEDILDISILPVNWDIASSTKICVLSTNTTKPSNTSTLTLLSIPNQLLDNEDEIENLYQNSTRLFNDDTVGKQCVVLSESVLSAVLTPDNGCFVVPKRSQELYKITLPSNTEKHCEFSLSDLTTFIGHELAGGYYGLSFHQRWLLSLGRDGQLMIRLTDKPNGLLNCTPHHYKSGGGQRFAITPDGQTVVTIGDKNTVTCWNWEPSSAGKSIISLAAEYCEGKKKQLTNTIYTQNSALLSLPCLDIEELGESTEKTWLEKAIIETHRTEDEKYAEQKAKLRQDIASLRKKVLAMISTNDAVPDIEKLERAEFILDTEEHSRHKQREEKEIEAIKEEIEINNLSKMYLRDVIKRQCWDEMKVKGKIVKAFLMRLEVSNYPLKERTQTELEELERVQTRRKIELSEKQTRKEVFSCYFKLFPRLSLVPEDVNVDDEEDYDHKESVDGDTSEPCALVGSRGDEFGGKTEYLYNQFELVDPVSKAHQIVLLRNSIRSIKEEFNDKFDELLRVKEAEIARINEKNIRIRKIARDLKVDEKLVEPSLDPDEQPERILTVKDEEVLVERYITEEERKRLEQRAKEEEERKLKEMADNWRDRGLDLMMDGRLEANAEEDLFKDMPRPDFMNKEVSELTEEEIRLKHDFEKKEANFLEERAKLIKSLEAEMNKSQETIQQIMESFDEKLKKLFNLKIRTEMALQEEELKVIRLSASLFMEDDVKMKEEQLEQNLITFKQHKVSVSNILLRTKKMVEEVQEEYDIMVAEDKEFDKSFKRDFADCDPFVDQLYRLFRKRPRGHKLRGGTSVMTVTTGPKTDNPFGPRPSSANLAQKPSIPAILHDRPEVVMKELDDPDNMPDGLDPIQWDRFVATRHRKVENEIRVKTKALELAEMKDFLRKREGEEDSYQMEIQNNYKDLTSLHDDKAVYDMNPEIQFLLRQGQVEISTGEGYVPDFSNSVLIHRSEIEEINSQIKTLGESKLSNMNECKDFKKGICMLEWELRRLYMEAEDLNVKAKDVQMLRVTKELQERLMMDNIQRKDQKQIETMEKTLELNQKTHERRQQQIKNKLESLKNEVKDRSTENTELEGTLTEKEVEVVERQQVQDLAGPPASVINADNRMKEIVSRSRLVELAKAQAKEVDVLRKEVERLRMKSFPALLQLDNI